MTGFGTELPIPNVRSSVANRGKADKICSMRVLRILTDAVDKVRDERIDALCCVVAGQLWPWLCITVIDG